MTTKKTDMDEMTSTELDEVTGGEGVAGGVAGVGVGSNAVNTAVESVVPRVNRPVAPIAPTVTEPWTGPVPGKR